MEVQTAARALEAAGRTVVHMEIGEPDFPTPAPVIAAAQKAIAAGDLYYTSALGLPALREAIARHYRDHYGVDVSPERIVVTAGSSAALLLVLALLVESGRPLPDGRPRLPVQPPFRSRARRRAGGRSRRTRDEATSSRRRWWPQNWDSRTRGALIASPSNPTGTSVAHDEMRRIAGAVARRGGHLVVDEIYLGLTYGSKPRSVLEFAHDAFVISSFSKYFNMTGWRLGWLVAPERHVRDLEKLAQNLYISPASPVAARGARVLRA